MNKLVPIFGFEGHYSVNALGEVFSDKSNLWLKQVMIKNGYLVVGLRKPGMSNAKVFRVHRLVAESLLEKVDGKNCINHKNGIKTANRLENLEWCSYSENNKHAYDFGLKKVGEYNSLSKLTNAQAREIKYGEDGVRQLSRAFKISPSVVSEIRNCKSWKHI